MATLLERFLKKVRKTSSCWIWTGAKTRGSYGHMNVKGKYVRAHRLSYLLFSGKIPKGKFVLHDCDTPRCVNPEHLFLGTQKENLADMTAKGRRHFRTRFRPPNPLGNDGCPNPRSRYTVR